jgi:hypothetical protein
MSEIKFPVSYARIRNTVSNSISLIRVFSGQRLQYPAILMRIQNVILWTLDGPYPPPHVSTNAYYHVDGHVHSKRAMLRNIFNP